MARELPVRVVLAARAARAAPATIRALSHDIVHARADQKGR